MKLFIYIMLILCGVFSLAETTEAQDQPQLTPEEAKQLMDGIAQKMKQIEQMLARASLKPEDLAVVMEQLREAANNKDFSRLPPALREFLLNNPDLLAKLKAPNQSGEELLRTEDDIRRLLATEDDGLEQLLSANPEMLNRLLDQQDQIEDALRQHSKLQNDLDRLFGQTKQQMESTEEDIKKLMDFAQQMQQQMDKQSQPNSDQLQQPDEGEGSQRPENKNEHVEGDPGKNNEQKPPEGGSNDGSTSRVPGEMTDKDAWEAILPQADLPPSAAAARRRAPVEWENEAEHYFLLLAKQAREERRLRESRRSSAPNE